MGICTANGRPENSCTTSRGWVGLISPIQIGEPRNTTKMWPGVLRPPAQSLDSLPHESSTSAAASSPAAPSLPSSPSLISITATSRTSGVFGIWWLMFRGRATNEKNCAAWVNLSTHHLAGAPGLTLAHASHISYRQ
eukprot:9504170-Pyramimonas_sp.AAC.2